MAFARAGDDVIGVDVDGQKVAAVTAHPNTDYHALTPQTSLFIDLRGITRGRQVSNLVRL